MKSIKHLTKHAGHIVAVNSPQILTAVGVVGTIATAYLAGKSAFKIGREVEAMKQETGEEADLKQTLMTAQIWKEFMPAIAVTSLTVTSIVCANRIQARRMAALAAAYAVLSGDFDEYKEKALEKLGAKKAKEIQDDVAQDRVLKDPPPALPATLETGKSWFCDLSTMHYFISDRQHVEKARNDLNYYLQHEGYADLNEAYAFLGLPSTNVGGQLGWQAEQQVDVAFSAVLMPDGGAATAFKFHPEPKPDFDSLH